MWYNNNNHCPPNLKIKMQSQIIATPKLFIGKDIHKKSWSVHLRTDLFEHKGFSMPPEPGKLAD